MKLRQTVSIHCNALFHGVPIIGFSVPQEELVRAAISRVPPQLMANVSKVVADKSMQPKHGNFDPKTKVVKLNPLTGNLRTRFGKGQGWAYHFELTAVHEFGHSVYDELPEERKAEWRALSGWQEGWSEGQEQPYVEKRSGWPPYTAKMTHKLGVKFPRKYSEKSDDEDFADCFAFFILSKAAQVPADKREYMKKLMQVKVTTYPRFAIESPAKPYGERQRSPV